MSFFGFSALGSNDLFLDFKEGDELIARRYIHCFDQIELENFFNLAGFKVTESRILRRGKSGRYSNIMVVGKSES